MDGFRWELSGVASASPFCTKIPVSIVSWCHDIKMTQPAHGDGLEVAEMALRLVRHLIDHFCLKQLLKFGFQMASEDNPL